MLSRGFGGMEGIYKSIKGGYNKGRVWGCEWEDVRGGER